MKIKKEHLLISLTSILCSMLFLFYACMEEDKETDTDEKKEFSSELEFGKNTELTKSIAKEWYQSSQKPVTRMIRDEGDDVGGILVMPSWNHAKEWRKGRYEVVEASLKTQKGIIFVDNETREKIDSESADLKKIKNIGRMVFLKDMETGEIINFNMVVIGSYKYLMKENNQLSKNTYLERDADFDGTILFYHPDGRFVNGWRYENGKITHRLSPLEEFNPPTKAWVERCYEDCYPYSENICENSIEDDEEFGQAPVIECRTEWHENCYKTCQIEWVDDPKPGGGDEGGYEPGGGSSGGTQSTPKINALYGSKSTLTNKQKQEVEKILGAMLSNPVFKKIYDMFVNGNKKIDFKMDPAMKASGLYDATNNSILFGDLSYTTEFVLMEEFFHAFQRNYVYSATVMLNDRNKFNIELEAHLFVDGAMSLKNGKFYRSDSNTIGLSGTEDLRRAVETLMNAIIRDGGFSEKHMNLYNDVAKNWTQYPGQYINTFKPTGMLEYLKK